MRRTTNDPSSVILPHRFELSISRADFVLQQASFIANIQTLVNATYNTAIVRLWCIQAREGTATAANTSGRRRLLQSAQ